MTLKMSRRSYPTKHTVKGQQKKNEEGIEWIHHVALSGLVGRRRKRRAQAAKLETLEDRNHQRHQLQHAKATEISKATKCPTGDSKGVGSLPLEVVAEEGDGRVAEDGGVLLALLHEMLQLLQLRRIHFSL